MATTYTTISGDTWDMIAYKTLGNEMLMGDLMKANAEYRKTVVFPAGITLTIPNIDVEIDSDLPPWKRGAIGE